MTLPHGIADELITEALASRLTDELVHVRSQLDPAEADRRIAQYVADTVARVVRTLPADNRAEHAAELANRVLELLSTEVERADLTQQDHLKIPPEIRLASYQPTLGTTEPTRPETPLRDTILFTNSPTEPNLASEIGKEMASADRVDALIAFVKWSGLRLIADQITEHLKAGKPLRVITTTYTGVTERRALDWLVEQGADVKVAYDAQATRLHAKAWLFERDTGFDTAWIGSSNLSKSALVDGLEWNVRASRVTSPDIVDKFTATLRVVLVRRPLRAIQPRAGRRPIRSGGRRRPSDRHTDRPVLRRRPALCLPASDAGRPGCRTPPSQQMAESGRSGHGYR